jgi:hypothetical protein
VKRLFFLYFILAISLLGCGARYKLGDETFGSSSEALQRQTEKLSQILSEIAPTDHPVHGSALILIPSDAEIQKNYIRLGNSAHRMTDEQLDWLITSATNIFQFTPNAIRKRGIFDSVSVERHSGNPAVYPIGDYDFVVFVDVDGWAIKEKATPRPVPIAVDKRKAAGRAHTLAFLDTLSEQARALKNK